MLKFSPNFYNILESFVVVLSILVHVVEAVFHIRKLPRASGFFSEECMVSEKLQISEKVYFREDVFIGYVLSPDHALDHIYICSNVYAATLHSYLLKYI